MYKFCVDEGHVPEHLAYLKQVYMNHQMGVYIKNQMVDTITELPELFHWRLRPKYIHYQGMAEWIKPLFTKAPIEMIQMIIEKYKTCQMVDNNWELFDYNNRNPPDVALAYVAMRKPHPKNLILFKQMVGMRMFCREANVNPKRKYMVGDSSFKNCLDLAVQYKNYDIAEYIVRHAWNGKCEVYYTWYGICDEEDYDDPYRPFFNNERLINKQMLFSDVCRINNRYSSVIQLKLLSKHLPQHVYGLVVSFIYCC